MAFPHTPESSKDPVDRAEALDEPEGKEDPGIPVSPDDPDVDPTDAGFPSSPELDIENTVVTPPNSHPEPGD
jgi:hypothetical protein